MRKAGVCPKLMGRVVRDLSAGDAYMTVGRNLRRAGAVAG
jgi:hypothetical protein